MKWFSLSPSLFLACSNTVALQAFSWFPVVIKMPRSPQKALFSFLQATKRTAKSSSMSLPTCFFSLVSERKANPCLSDVGFLLFTLAAVEKASAQQFLLLSLSLSLPRPTSRYAPHRWREKPLEEGKGGVCSWNHGVRLTQIANQAFYPFHLVISCRCASALSLQALCCHVLALIRAKNDRTCVCVCVEREKCCCSVNKRNMVCKYLR